VVVGFDAAGISGGLVGPGLGRRVRRWARVPLQPGALEPGLSAVNLPRPGEVVAAVAELRRQLGSNGASASLILPDGLARLRLLERQRGASPRDLARFRLAPSLPYPPAEAQFAVWPLAGGRLLASAARRSVIEEYESAAAAAGLRQRRLSLASYAALSELLRSAGPPEVAAILGDTTLSLAGLDVTGLRCFRSRLRDPAPDEAERLWEEAERTAQLAGFESFGLVLVGSGAASLLEGLAASGRRARPGWRGVAGDGGPVSCELSWLGAA
jgi:hypothetical protein